MSSSPALAFSPARIAATPRVEMEPRALSICTGALPPSVGTPASGSWAHAATSSGQSIRTTRFSTSFSSETHQEEHAERNGARARDDGHQHRLLLLHLQHDRTELRAAS